MKNDSARSTARRKLDEAYEALERHAPEGVSRVLRWLRKPRGKKARLAAGTALVVLGALGPLLPVAGIWMLPLGLLLLAEDVPRMQGCVVKLTLWFEGRWLKLRSWWQRRFQPA